MCRGINRRYDLLMKSKNEDTLDSDEIFWAYFLITIRRHVIHSPQFHQGQWLSLPMTISPYFAGGNSWILGSETLPAAFNNLLEKIYLIHFY
jgi:hypothetical protein